MDLLLDLKGFSKENAIKFANKILTNCYDDENAIETFMNAIEGNQLATQIIHVPLLLLILTHVWFKNGRSLPSKLHEFYILFIDMLTKRVKDKYKSDPNHRQIKFTQGDMRSPLPSKISKNSLVDMFGEGLFLSLCEVAHHFLHSSQKENSLVFEETKLLNVLGDRREEKLKIALDLGVLSVTDSMSYLDKEMNVSFLHKTFQEFFTALCFIVSQDKLANFVSSIADLNDVQQNENIIVFLVGLMPELGNSVLEKVNELCKDNWEALKKMELMNPEKSMCIEALVFHAMFKHIYQLGDDRLHNISNIYLRCNDDLMGENVLLNVSGLVLEQNIFNPHPWNPGLQNVILMGRNITDSLLVDLRGLTGLGYLRLERFTCELYLPESGSLCVFNMMSLRLSSCCCDVLGRMLTQCMRLEKLAIQQTNLHNCLLDLSNMTKLTILHMFAVTLSSSCCDRIGSTLTHCTKLRRLDIKNIDLHNCVLDLTNMTELTHLDMSKVTLSSSCCVHQVGSTVTHCTKLEWRTMKITDFHNCVLDLSNMTELTHLYMLEVTLSSSCCDVLGSTLTHCTKLECLKIKKIDLHNCVSDLSKMTELTDLVMSKVTLSSGCCNVLGSTLTHCTKLKDLEVFHINLHNCVLDLSNMIELTDLYMSKVTLSSSCCNILGSNMTELKQLCMSNVALSSCCCDVLGSTLTHCTKLIIPTLENTELSNSMLDLSMTKLFALRLNGATLPSSACQVLEQTLNQLKARKHQFRNHTYEKLPSDNDK